MKQKYALVLLATCSGWICIGQGLQPGPTMSTVQMRAVKGNPFSAKVVTESKQVLADGNLIVRNNVASVARDGEGRTRSEQSLREFGPAWAGAASVVFIQDPTAAVVYVLEPQSKLARKRAAAVAETASQPADIQRGAPKTEPTSIKTEWIGTQIIEGLQAEGTRITRTLAAGQAGNERVLEIVSDSWFSGELQAIVMNRTTDPRLGETIYRLTEIQRGEPLHSLFEIPAGYSISEELPALGRRLADKGAIQ